MDKAYANGEMQETEQGKNKTADFVNFAQGMGIAVVSAVTAKAAINEFKEAQANRVFTEVRPEDGGHTGEKAGNLNSHDAAGLGMAVAVAIVVASNQSKMKKAFVYGVKKTAQGSKKLFSFAKSAIEEMQKFTQEHVAEDRENPNKPTMFNKINKFMGSSGR